MTHAFILFDFIRSYDNIRQCITLSGTSHFLQKRLHIIRLFFVEKMTQRQHGNSHLYSDLVRVSRIVLKNIGMLVNVGIEMKDT